LRKHGYNEGINSVLRLETATPMALKRSIYNMINVNIRQNNMMFTTLNWPFQMKRCGFLWGKRNGIVTL